MTFYGRIRIREKGPDPTGSGSATLLVIDTFMIFLLFFQAICFVLRTMGIIIYIFLNKFFNLILNK